MKGKTYFIATYRRLLDNYRISFVTQFFNKPTYASGMIEMPPSISFRIYLQLYFT